MALARRYGAQGQFRFLELRGLRPAAKNIKPGFQSTTHCLPQLNLNQLSQTSAYYE